MPLERPRQLVDRGVLDAVDADRLEWHGLPDGRDQGDDPVCFHFHADPVDHHASADLGNDVQDGRVQIHHLHYNHDATVQRLALVPLSQEVSGLLIGILETGLIE